jgi:hypothetical protein
VLRKPAEGSNTDAAEVNGRFAAGKQHLRDGRYGLALETFKAALAREPGSIRVLNAIGASYDKLGRSDIAETYYKRALALDPASVQTLNNRGYSLMLQGRAEDALPYLARAAKSQDKDGQGAIAARNYQMAVRAAESASTAKIERASLADHAEASTFPESCVMGPVWLERRGERVYSLITEPSAAAAVAMQRLSSFSGPRDNVSGDATRATSCIAAIRAAYGFVPSLEIPTQLEETTSQLRGSAGLTQKGVSTERPPETEGKTVRHVAKSAVGAVVDVSNGAGRDKLAARIRRHYEFKGLPVDRITNASSFDHATTVIFFRAGFKEVARRYAEALPTSPRLELADQMSTDLRIQLGGDILNFDSAELLQGNKKLSFLPESWT